MIINGTLERLDGSASGRLCTVFQSRGLYRDGQSVGLLAIGALEERLASVMLQVQVQSNIHVIEWANLGLDKCIHLSGRLRISARDLLLHLFGGRSDIALVDGPCLPKRARDYCRCG